MSSIDILILSVAILILSPVIISILIGAVICIFLLIAFTFAFVIMVWDSICNVCRSVNNGIRNIFR